MRAAFFLLALSAGCADVSSYEGVAYDARFGDATAMDIHVPADADASPAVMLVHGGGWHMGTREALDDHARRFARAGYVAATVSYRLVPEIQYPDNVRDVACALAFLQASASDYGLDPRRIVLFGYSAGAHLSSLLAVAGELDEHQPSCEAGAPVYPPAGVISGAGPQDMRLFPDADSVVDYLGGPQDAMPEVWARASPITHVDAGDPPQLMLHGTADLIVDIEHARRMRDALRAVGVQALLLEMRGGGHLLNPGVNDAGDVFAPLRDVPEAWLASLDFLERTVGTP